MKSSIQIFKNLNHEKRFKETHLVSTVFHTFSQHYGTSVMLVFLMLKLKCGCFFFLMGSRCFSTSPCRFTLFDKSSWFNVLECFLLLCQRFRKNYFHTVEDRIGLGDCLDRVFLITDYGRDRDISTLTAV